MWHDCGLETIINVTRMEQESILAVLKDEPVRTSNPLQYMILRAKYNQQRHYEIYAFESEIDEEEIIDMFDVSPQVIVDAIRGVGVKLYSDRCTKKKVIV